MTESLLAFTIFRDDFDIPFVVMFGFLLFIKCFHWLIADRVESVREVPSMHIFRPFANTLWRVQRRVSIRLAHPHSMRTQS